MLVASDPGGHSRNLSAGCMLAEHGAGMGNWAHAHGVLVCPKVDFFARSGAPLQGFGARARAPLERGELLLQVPLKACILPIDVVNVPSFVDEQQKLMLSLLREVLVRDGTSQWRPYLDTLPQSFSTLPLGFNRAETRLLQGTSVDEILAGRHIANAKDLEAIAAWCRSVPGVFPPDTPQPGLQELRWAASVVASRAFDSTEAGVVLAPFADALNHSGTTPHTRMRDCGDVLTFHLERPAAAGEEILNCYGEHGNLQWLLNGGFVEWPNPFDELLVSPTEAVTAALEHLRTSQLDAQSVEEVGGAEGEGNVDVHQDSDDEGRLEEGVGVRLAFLRASGLFEEGEAFRVRADDLLPDHLATLLLVLCMSRKAFAEYRMRSVDRRLIDVATEGGGELISDQLLHGLYSALLRIVELLECRLGTLLEDDEAKLQHLEVSQVQEVEADEAVQCQSVHPPKKQRHALQQSWCLGGNESGIDSDGSKASDAANMLANESVDDLPRPQNLRNLLILRVGQQRILRALRKSCEDCFASDTESEV